MPGVLPAAEVLVLAAVNGRIVVVVEGYADAAVPGVADAEVNLCILAVDGVAAHCVEAQTPV